MVQNESVGACCSLDPSSPKYTKKSNNQNHHDEPFKCFGWQQVYPLFPFWIKKHLNLFRFYLHLDYLPVQYNIICVVYILHGHTVTNYARLTFQLSSARKIPFSKGTWIGTNQPWVNWLMAYALTSSDGDLKSNRHYQSPVRSYFITKIRYGNYYIIGIFAVEFCILSWWFSLQVIKLM